MENQIKETIGQNVKDNKDELLRTLN
jgi:hypothetical protein